VIITTDKEQVRKRGLPPLVVSKQQRGQAPLPDLFFIRGLILLHTTIIERGVDLR
jgi:hypothetical protein